MHFRYENQEFLKFQLLITFLTKRTTRKKYLSNYFTKLNFEHCKKYESFYVQHSYFQKKNI